MNSFDKHNALWGNLGKRYQVVALVHFFNQMHNAEAAKTKLFDVFMDMELLNLLTKIDEKDDSRDVRPVVAEHLSYHIYSTNGDGLGRTLEPDSLDIMLAILAIIQ